MKRQATSNPNTWSVPTVTASTNLGPLTAPAALPTDCLQKLWDFQTPGLGTGVLYSYYTQGCAASSCCPSSMAPYTTAYQWLSSYHSPAVCPSLWKACPGPSNLSPAITSETIAFCCPSAYVCPNDPILSAPWWACHSVLGTTTTAYIMDNLKSQNTITTRLVTTLGNWDVAYPLQIRWQASDSLYMSLPTITASSQARSTLVSGTSSTPTSSTTNIPQASTSGGGLSTAAKIAIGVVIPLVFLAILAFAFLLLRRRKNKTKSEEPIESGFTGPSELDSKGGVPVIHDMKSELPSSERAKVQELEVGAVSRNHSNQDIREVASQELDSNQYPKEGIHELQ